MARKAKPAAGYIGLTDPDWYSFLSAHPRVDEVNFWRPHGGVAFQALRPRLGEDGNSAGQDLSARLRRGAASA